jgi:hypothetical protein
LDNNGKPEKKNLFCGCRNHGMLGAEALLKADVKNKNKEIKALSVTMTEEK